MKKLSISFVVCSILVMFAALMSSGCQKDITTTNSVVTKTGVDKVMQTPSKESMELKKNGDPTFTFENLNAKVKVENGILFFETSRDFSKTITFIQNATPKEMVKWENSLVGFQSIYRSSTLKSYC